MRILLYSLNFAPELTGIGKYSGELGAWLSSRSNSIRVVTSPPYYPEWQIHPGYRRYWWQRSCEYGMHIIRCPLYVPKQPTARSRLLHLASFALSSLFPLLAQLRWKPDIVLLVAPTLFCAPGALLFSLLHRTHTILHVQDYEVDALFGLGMTNAGKMQALALWLERWLLRRFDSVSTISNGMLKRAIKKGVSPNKLLLFPNWSELEHFRNAIPSEPMLAQLGVPPGRRVLLYSGNMGEKQGLELVLEAADALRGRSDLYFLLVGNGAGRQRLEQRAIELTLDNVGFASLQPWAALPSLLSSAAVHLVIQRRGAADAVLPSKLTNILAVGGNSVITADEDTTLGQLCIEHVGIAIRVDPDSLSALLAGIDQALRQPLPNITAQKYACEHLDKERILLRFEVALQELVTQGKSI